MNITVHGKKTVVVKTDGKMLISDAIRASSEDFSMPCGGNGSCGKCLVKVTGNVSERMGNEKKLLKDAPNGMRLACFAYALGDCDVFLNETKADILADSINADFAFIPMCKGYGFAVDIGTTTVSVRLYDLKNGQILATDTFLNPQRSFGADVITRIKAANEGEARNLSNLIRKALYSSFNMLCEDNKIKKSDISVAVITGNTTMLYLLAGIGTKCLSAYPFEISEFFGKTYDYSAFGFDDFINMSVYLPKTVSAFVGSDTVCACLLATDYLKENGGVLLVDIGTNGETVLFFEGKIYCCSTAAGPAFEGVGISMGMSASSGAVSSARLNGEKIEYEVIGGGKAIGICGSGLIDAVSTFLKLKLIDETGCIDETKAKNCDLLVELSDDIALKIGDSGVFITQKDIRNLQLAKSAVCAGVQTLLHECNINPESVSKLLIAGGFGNGIDFDNAGAIGLIPKELCHKAEFLGNAALGGASSILLSENALKVSLEIAEKAKNIELSNSIYFGEKYIESMML